MKITEKTWIEYISRLSRLHEEAGRKMADYINQYGTQDTDAIMEYAAALVQKYGEGTAELACQMYDAVAEASGASVPPAEPAATANYTETAKMVNGTKHSPSLLQGGVSRLVKRAGADTTLKNAIRDGAEFAWVPHGDTCPFCITLASRGWQKASEKALKGGHAEHIHANCDCEYAIRFDSRTTVAGYDPDKYLTQYNAAGGNINAMRREQYAENKDKINAQKRAAYAARKAHSGPENVLEEYKRKATPGQGSITYDEGYNRTRHAEEIKTAQWLHDTLGGDIMLLNESNIQGQKMPDYLWRNSYWDLKTLSSEKAANSAIRHGLQQIRNNPGGLILDMGDLEVSLDELNAVIEKRMQWNQTKAAVDIMVIQKGKPIEILRYQKK